MVDMAIEEEITAYEKERALILEEILLTDSLYESRYDL